MAAATTATRGLGLVLELSTSSSGASSTAAAVVLATLAAHGARLALAPEERRVLALDTILDNGGVTFGASPSGIVLDDGWSRQPAVLKHLKVQPRRVVSAFCPRNVLFSVAKSVLLPFGLLLDEWFEKVKEAELVADMEEAEVEWPPFPKERVRPALRHAAYAFARDMSITLLRLAAQNWVWRHAAVEVANKLLKDFRASAIRKTAKLRWYLRPARLAATVCRSTALGYAADCTVSIAFETVVTLRGPKPPPGVDHSVFLRRRVWAVVRYNVARCAIACAFASCAVGIVTTLVPGYPGPAASLSYLAGDAYAQLVLVPALWAGSV